MDVQFSLPSRLLKLPIVEIQKFCYNGNLTSHFSSLLLSLSDVIRGNTSGGITKCCLFKTAKNILMVCLPRPPYYAQHCKLRHQTMHCSFYRHQCPLKTETNIIQERSTWEVLKNNLIDGQQKNF